MDPPGSSPDVGGWERVVFGRRPVVPLIACMILLGIGPVGLPSTIASSPSAGPTWAYGGTLEGSGSTTVGGVSVTFTDATNYAVVVAQTNYSSSDALVTVSRAMGTRGEVTACYPSCTAPTYELTGSSRGTEFETATLDVATARVQVTGSTVAAWGLRSERLNLSGNLTIGLTWTNRSDPSHPLEEWFNASTSAATTGTFDFTTPLGLLPTAWPPGGSWNTSQNAVENSTTVFSGAVGYEGNLIPSNRSPFGGTSTPISPAPVALSGRTNGTPSDPRLNGTTNVLLAPTTGTVSVLEGAIFVPAAAYLFAGFDSSCDLAQRPCVANVSSPGLDYPSYDPLHLGPSAAASSVSAFGLRFDARAVADLPNGAPFWPAAAGVRPAGPAVRVVSGPAVVGLPEPVVSAEAVVNALHDSVHPPNVTVLPPAPVPHGTPSHASRGSGPAAGSAVPIAPLAGPSGLSGTTLGLVLVAAAVVVGLAALAVRRRRPPRPEPNEEPPPEPAAEAEEGEDPMGYVY